MGEVLQENREKGQGEGEKAEEKKDGARADFSYRGCRLALFFFKALLCCPSLIMYVSFHVRFFLIRSPVTPETPAVDTGIAVIANNERKGER